MQRLALATLLVRDYDEAIAYYVGALGFILQEDTMISPAKRWVVVAPALDSGGALLLALADTEAQRASLGRQTGGRVGFFLHTDNFMRDYTRMQAAGVDFQEEPRHEPYGTVVVFADLYGNRWDLLERKV